jgi:molybdate transport system substrate-binding protein
MGRQLAKYLILLALCPGRPSRAADDPSRPRHVRVAAASDLKFALDDVVKEFQAHSAGISVQPTYGSSGNFYAQIQGGAPFDLFLSADVSYTQRLATEGLTLAGSEFVYGIGRLVLWVPGESTLDVSRGLVLLRDPQVQKVSIANPRHAPYGRAAEAALKAAGLWQEVAPKGVFGENVAQAAQFVQSGAADAGILALSLAKAPPMASAGRYFEIPAASHPPLVQGGVILKRAGDPEAAARFRAFLTGEAGRAILARYGFVTPEK